MPYNTYHFKIDLAMIYDSTGMYVQVKQGEENHNEIQAGQVMFETPSYGFIKLIWDELKLHL